MNIFLYSLKGRLWKARLTKLLQEFSCHQCLMPGWLSFWSYRPCLKVLKGKFSIELLALSFLALHLPIFKEKKKTELRSDLLFFYQTKNHTLSSNSHSDPLAGFERVCVWMRLSPIISAPLEGRESMYSCWDTARGRVGTNMTTHFCFTLWRMSFQEHLKTIAVLGQVKTV